MTVTMMIEIETRIEIETVAAPNLDTRIPTRDATQNPEHPTACRSTTVTEMVTTQGVRMREQTADMIPRATATTGLLVAATIPATVRVMNIATDTERGSERDTVTASMTTGHTTDAGVGDSRGRSDR